MKIIYLLLNAVDYDEIILQAFEDDADLHEKMHELVEEDEKEGWLAHYSQDKVYCWLNPTRDKSVSQVSLHNNSTQRERRYG